MHPCYKKNTIFEGITVLLTPQLGSINNNTSTIEHHQIFKDSMSNFYPLLITPERPVHTYAQTEYMQRCIQHIYQASTWSVRHKQFSPRRERSECFIKSETMLSSQQPLSWCECVFTLEWKKQWEIVCVLVRGKGRQQWKVFVQWSQRASLFDTPLEASGNKAFSKIEFYKWT